MSRKTTEWALIHQDIADILQRVKYTKTGDKEYIKVQYFGNAESLRKNCTRILNLLDRMEGKYE